MTEVLNNCPMPTQQWCKLITRRMVHEALPSITQHYIPRNAWSGDSQGKSTTSWPTSKDPVMISSAPTLPKARRTCIKPHTSTLQSNRQSKQLAVLIEQGFLINMCQLSLLASRRGNGNMHLNKIYCNTIQAGPPTHS
jgi:hypothetical protein